MPPLGACPSNANNFDLKAKKTEHLDRLVGIRGSLPRAMLRLIADQAAKNPAAFVLLAPRRLPLTYARLYAEIQKHALVLRAIGISRCSGSFCVRAEGKVELVFVQVWGHAVETSVLEWRERVFCSACGSRKIDMVVIGTERR